MVCCTVPYAHITPATAASAAPMTKVAEMTMSGARPSGGHPRVLGRGAHRAAQLGAVDQAISDGQDHRRGDEDQDLRDR